MGFFLCAKVKVKNWQKIQQSFILHIYFQMHREDTVHHRQFPKHAKPPPCPPTKIPNTLPFRDHNVQEPKSRFGKGYCSLSLALHVYFSKHRDDTVLTITINPKSTCRHPYPPPTNFHFVIMATPNSIKSAKSSQSRLDPHLSPNPSIVPSIRQWHQRITARHLH